MVQPASPDSVLIIGVGNAYRGDDGVGLAAAQVIRRRLGTPATVREASGEPASLMALWQETETVVVIDAVISGAAPGTIHRFDAHAARLPAEWFHCSTHNFGVVEAIELARAWGQLPPRLIVFGIEGRSFEPGCKLTPPVERAVERVVQDVLEEVPVATTREMP